MYEIILAIAIIIVTLIVVVEWQHHSYWKWKGVPGPLPAPLIGHMHLGFFDYHWHQIDEMYQKFKSNGFWGMYEFFSPIFVVSDPILIKNMLIKDADFFLDRRECNFGEETYVFKEVVSFKNGPEWKSLRAAITPTFTNGKIKAMFPLLTEKGKEFIKECEKDMKSKGAVDFKSLSGYYTLDTIASCAFGVDASCLSYRENSEFAKSTSSVMNFSTFTILKFIIHSYFPRLGKILNLQIFNGMEYLQSIVEKTVQHRRESGSRRGDFLDLLLDTMKEPENLDDQKYHMSIQTVISQCIMFIFGGFDTTGNALGLTLGLLAKHTDEQRKLREELLSVLGNGEGLTYQNVTEAHYLDAVISESLRLYPPAHYIERSCVKKYKIPGSNVEIPEKMNVGFPAFSLHRDPNYWNDPLIFIPDRFLPENKNSINSNVYMPFGLGPRNCLAMRFALMQLKVAISMIVLNFDFSFRPGFHDVTLARTMNTLRPNKDGIQVVMRKICPDNEMRKKINCIEDKNIGGKISFE